MLLTIIILVIIIGGAWLAVRRFDGLRGAAVIKDSGENVSDYSAVFLTNGQVYFGKIQGKTATEIDLRDIFYLQVSQQNLQQGGNATPAPQNPDVSLVKLGNELHGPTDRMSINMEQVLFTESLKSDSKVVTAISDYKKK